MPELGLFPLSIVLVPTERIPLHIFEPRYRELIAECIANGEEFGLVLAAGDGAVHEVGTRAAVAQVLEELPDGRMDVVIEGGDRFRLLELTSGRSFATAVVENIVDEDEPYDDADAERALELFGRLAESTDSEVDLPDPTSPYLDFELAARVDFGVEAKQELLATTSPRRRMARLAELLETALDAVALQQELQRRASGNGRVSPLNGDGPETPDDL